MRTGLGGGNVNGLGGGWRAHSKPCDSCKTVAAALFCRADSAFLCLVCDDRIHAANKLASRHARVWVCEVCEHAPASVTCKADAAALCASCDADIHSANPLARRHERVPVVPFLDSAAAALRSSCELDVFLTEADGGTGACAPPDDEIVPQWVLPSPRVDAPKVVEADEVKCGDVLLNVMDPYFDFDYGFPNPGSDGLVPVQVKPDPFPVNPSPEEGFDIDFCRSKFSSFGYPAQSIGQSVSSSSQDFGVVPDGAANTMSDMSHSFAGSIGCSITDPSTNTTPVIQATQLCGVDREARVLRYKEKRKNRKFEKTIRYASRKAYAETRPRIKGRFAKRTDSEPQLVDNIYSSSPAVYFGDNDFGVVPTF